MAKSKMLAINCSGNDFIPLSKLKPFQGGFKELRPAEREKLKLEMKELGMLEPISVWKDADGVAWIMNGHQRASLLRAMVKAEEIDIAEPGLPVCYVQAKDAEQAAKAVLALASTYGRINKKGFAKFLDKNGFEEDYVQERFSFPELDNAEAEDEKKKVEFNASKKPKLVKCPKCGEIFDQKVHKHDPNKKAKIEGYEEASACGLGIIGARTRVIDKNGIATEFVIDRWE